MQVFPPPAAPEGPAADQREEPPGVEERSRPADAAADHPWSDACCHHGESKLDPILELTIQPSPVRLAVCFSAAHLLALPARPGVPPAPGQRWPDCSPAVSSSTPTPGSPADTATAAATTGQTAQRPH